MLLISAVLILAFGCAGCSFRISYILKNLAGKTVVVKYRVKSVQDGFAPSLVRKSEAEGTQFVPIPDDRISLDFENRSIEFKMLADEMVELEHTIDRRDSEYEQEFNLESLQIIAEDGSVSMEGRDLFKSFRPVRKSWYAFGPEIVGFELEYR